MIAEVFFCRNSTDFEDSVDKIEILLTVHVAPIPVNDTVPIEKQPRLHCAASCVFRGSEEFYWRTAERSSK
jgi:hypothetical protein